MFTFDIFYHPQYLGVFLLSYLLGSIPFGLIFTFLAGKGDIRSIGSGNIGTTNALRAGGKKIAALTLLGDLLKGTIAVLLAKYIFHKISYFPADVSGFFYIPLAGFFAFLGHLYPIWLKFKGGKGVATYIGILLGLAWPMAILFGVIWVLTALFSRYSSLSALIATAVLPIFSYLFYGTSIAFFITLMSVFVFIKHKENIKRLCQGSESKIGQKNNDCKK